MDPAIISPTVRQLEQFRAYYQFTDPLDVDRYEINGESQDTVVSVRELDMEALGTAGTWQNRTVVYTHGYGLVVAAGNQRTSDGNPVFLERGIPATGFLSDSENFQPRVYFGEQSPVYSIVGAPDGTTPVELDYPRGSEDGQSETKTTLTKLNASAASGQNQPDRIERQPASRTSVANGITSRFARSATGETRLNQCAIRGVETSQEANEAINIKRTQRIIFRAFRAGQFSGSSRYGSGARSRSLISTRGGHKIISPATIPKESRNPAWNNCNGSEKTINNAARAIAEAMSGLRLNIGPRKHMSAMIHPRTALALMPVMTVKTTRTGASQ